MTFQTDQQARYDRAQVAAMYDDQDAARKRRRAGGSDSNAFTLAIGAAIFLAAYVAVHVWNVASFWVASVWPF